LKSAANALPSWIEVRVQVPLGWHELVAEVLSAEPLTSVVFGQTSIGMPAAPAGFDWVRGYYAAKSDSPELRAQISERLNALAGSTAAPELAELALQFKQLPHEDFATSWKKTWKPFRVRDLCVVPSWYAGTLRATDTRLQLEPGGSFGSGRHATTRTCLKVIQERMQPAAAVVDCGAGSGILSIASALCGASSVLGFDIDPNACDYGNALASDNGVAGRCTFRQGGFEVLGPDDGPFDVVLANIYSDVIQANATRLRALLKPGGWFAFSGCPLHHLDATRAAIQSAQLALEEERVRGRWVTFVGR